MPITTEHPLARRLRLTGQRLHDVLLRRERRIIILSVVVFVTIIAIIGAWKIWALAYNALDLAIYNQVAWNSVHGRWFEFTIHPHSYLGDHFEIAFALLWPFYALIQHPLTLIVLQATAIAVAVIPLTRIAAHFVGKPWHLLFGLAYLANPTIQNMALYEFHLLPFAIPLVSWALVGYVERKYRVFLLCAALALTVREDISFVVIGFGLLALVDRRDWKWWAVPIGLGAAWLLTSLKLSAIFNDYGSYKFLVYYAWLGDSVPNIILGALKHPWLVIQHLLTFQNLGFLAGLLLPFALLPIFRLRWIIPAGLTLLQLLLAVSSGELLIEIHYPAVIIPFLVAAAAAAFRSVLSPPPTGIFRAIGSERAMATIIYVAVILYGMFVIGPLAKAVPILASTGRIADRVRLERDLTRAVAGQPTVAGFEQLTELSAQEKLYSLHYVLLGNKQFSDVAYVLPDDAAVILLDLRDTLIYHLLYEDQDLNHHAGYARIRKLLTERGFVPTTYIDRFVVYTRQSPAEVPTYTRGPVGGRRGNPSHHADLSFLGWSSPAAGLTTETARAGDRQYSIVPLDLTFVKTNSSDEILQLELRLSERGRIVYRTIMPFGGGIYPTSDWTLSEVVTSHYRPMIPDNLNGRVLDAEVRVMRLRGDVVLNGVRSLVLRYNRYETVGSPIGLGQLTVAR